MKNALESKIKKASECAAVYGVKILIHGGPGSGKTPILATAPSPIICSTEPGLLSLRHWDGPVWEAYTAESVEGFFSWLAGSNEAKQYETVAIDSISQLAEIYLESATQSHKHGLAAYGSMAKEVWAHAFSLYYMKEKHIVLTAKQFYTEENSGLRKRPYLPGRELNMKIPHLYDEILALGTFDVPNRGKRRALCTRENIEFVARDRSGRLNEFEPTNLTKVINKCKS